MWLKLILFLWLCAPGGSSMAQPVEVDAGRASFEVAGHLWASAPQDILSSPQEALARYRAGQFQKLPGYLGRGYQKDVVWLAFDVPAATAEWQFLVAHVGPAYLDYVSAWQADAAGQIRLLGHAGDQIPLAQVEIPALKASFALQLEGAASSTVLLRIQTTSAQVAIVKLYRATHFPSEQAKENLVLGLQSAAFLIMSVVAMGMFWVLRERIYLLWLGLILILASQAFMSTGMGYFYLHWDDLYNVNKFTNGMTSASVVILSLFANAMFDFKSLHRWLYRFIVGLSAFVIVLAAVGIALTLPKLAPVFLFVSVAMMIALSIGIVIQMMRRHPASLRYGPMFLLSFLVALVTMLAIGSSWLPFSELTASAWQVANLCNLLSLQISMFSRAMEARRIHSQERTRLLVQLTQQNQELEARVESRTASLSKALNDVQQAESSQRQLLTMASHEFRTPAAWIKSSLDSLAILKDQIPPEIASRLTNMRQASLRMISLANDLINEDRLHELALKPHIHLMDLRQLVADVVARYAGEAELVSDLLTSPLHIRGDAALLGIALHNLIDNALRHAHPKPPEVALIRVSLQVQNDHVELSVADNGPGIPESKREWVFARYHSGPYRDFNDGDGRVSVSSGLGLSIVQDIANAHGGRAVVRDVHPHGALLALVLPL
jgi:signal transduction histidine kinase